MIVGDHNDERWLVVQWHDREQGGMQGIREAGWYVVRCCPCHFGHTVTIAYDTRAEAERVRGVILSVRPKRCERRATRC